MKTYPKLFKLDLLCSQAKRQTNGGNNITPPSRGDHLWTVDTGQWRSQEFILGSKS